MEYKNYDFIIIILYNLYNIIICGIYIIGVMIEPYRYKI